MATTTPGLRLLRAALVLAVLIAPATLAHEHAESAPSLVSLALTALALSPFAWFAAARTLERRTLIGAAACAQVLSHAAFGFLHPHGTHGLALDMIAAHALAGLVSATALAYADELRAFAEACLMPLRAFFLAPPSPPTVVRRVPIALAATTPHREHFLATVQRRGPPTPA